MGTGEGAKPQKQPPSALSSLPQTHTYSIPTVHTQSLLSPLSRTPPCMHLQDLIDAAKQHLRSNRARLQQLAAHSSCALQEDSEAYAGFTQAVSEWDAQVSGVSAGVCVRARACVCVY